MYSVMLLDDEPWELMGIREMFPWEQHGFHVKYALDNPQDALRILREEPVDVLISDIRMPDMSGLELLDLIRKAAIRSEVVFLSGHAEFSFAQQSIRLGAFDYFLKPFDFEHFDPFIKRLADHLAEKNRINALVFYDKVISGNIMISEICGELKTYSRVLFSRTKDIRFEIQENINPVYIAVAPHQYLCFITYNTQIKHVSELISMNPESLIGVSLEIQGEKNTLQALIEQAQTAFYDYFISEQNRLVEFYDNNLNSIKTLVELFISVYSTNEYVQIQKFINSLPDLFVARQINAEGVMTFWNQCIFHCISDNLLYPEYYFQSLEQFVNFFDTVESMCEKLFSLVKYSIYGESKLPSPDEDRKELFDQMVDFINENYMNHINLQDLSTYINTNSTYVCRLFKRYADTTFSKYLTNLRINKACHLLVSTNYTIEDICCRTGYTDYFYFSKVFKKSIGTTPYQYRKDSRSDA